MHSASVDANSEEAGQRKENAHNNNLTPALTMTRGSWLSRASQRIVDKIVGNNGPDLDGGRGLRSGPGHSGRRGLGLNLTSGSEFDYTKGYCRFANIPALAL